LLNLFFRIMVFRIFIVQDLVFVTELVYLLKLYLQIPCFDANTCQPGPQLQDPGC
jgi:hypothetical protein